ncbi:MAG: ATP-binding protein [Chloroflexota bacterium]
MRASPLFIFGPPSGADRHKATRWHNPLGVCVLGTARSRSIDYTRRRLCWVSLQSSGGQISPSPHVCPCGYFGDPYKACTCASSAVTKYQKRISGPLLDRIDIHVEVPRVEYQKLSEDRLVGMSLQAMWKSPTACPAALGQLSKPTPEIHHKPARLAYPRRSCIGQSCPPPTGN